MTLTRGVIGPGPAGLVPVAVTGILADAKSSWLPSYCANHGALTTT